MAVAIASNSLRLKGIDLGPDRRWYITDITEPHSDQIILRPNVSLLSEPHKTNKSFLVANNT